jgi:hypothetical protein
MAITLLAYRIFPMRRPIISSDHLIYQFQGTDSAGKTCISRAMPVTFYKACR